MNLIYLAVVGLATTPGLIMAWGATNYGIWLMLTSIPVYLALSDLGFSTAATNAMAMAFAKGERERVKETFHSLIALNFAAFAVVMGLTLTALLGAATVSNNIILQQYGVVIVGLAAFSCLSMFSRVLLAGFRATEQYTKGTLVYDAGQFAGNIGIIPVALLGGKFEACVATWIFCRLITIALLWRMLNPLADYLTVGLQRARLAVLRDLLHPAVGSLAIPSALALNQQGVALIVGAVISPAATATLSSVRTATRLAVQAISAINRATVPELSAAGARRDQKAVARIVWINILAIVAVMLPTAVIFAAYGPRLVALWTGGVIVPTEEFVIVMTLGMLLHACWYFGTNLLMATNEHLPMVNTLLITSVASAVLSWPAATYWGLSGAAAVGAVAEAACLIRFLFAARKFSPVLSNRVLHTPSHTAQ
ncbi:lipopolysaccharide biosynthesis protein [Bradyrhizobium liaoningense]